MYTHEFRQRQEVGLKPFAQELAQWMRDDAFPPPTNPVLEPIESIERRDAIIDLTAPTISTSQSGRTRNF